MSLSIPIYVIYKPTGQKDENGAELCIIIDVKLTYASAMSIATKHEGALVKKMKADKFMD